MNKEYLKYSYKLQSWYYFGTKKFVNKNNKLSKIFSKKYVTNVFFCNYIKGMDLIIYLLKVSLCNAS